MTYYAVALNTDGRIEQMIVTRDAGGASQRWTGVIYLTMKLALISLTRLNAEA